MRFKGMTVAFAAAALLATTSGAALAGEADEIAVEAAKKFAGTELTLFLEAGPFRTRIRAFRDQAVGRVDRHQGST